MRLGFGVGVVDVGTQGGVADAADGATSAAALFLAADGPLGMVLDFADASVAIVSSGGSLDYQSQGQVSNGALVGPGAKLTYTAPSLKNTEQADGFIKFQAHNIAFPSHSITTGWTISNATVTTGIEDHQGGTTALRITSTGAFGTYYRDFAAVAGATYSNEVLIRAVNVTGAVNFYSPETGNYTNIGPSLTSSWQKFTATNGVSPASIRWRVALANAGDSVDIVNIHTRHTPSASDYVATTTAAVYDLPYVYSSGVRTGILPEPAATNVLLRSTDFSNAAWGSALASVTANAAVAPDGTTTASLIYPASTGAFRDKTQQYGVGSSAVYTVSCYLKASGFRWAYFRNMAASGLGAHFDLQTGTVGAVQSGYTASIIAVGNGWYRCTMTNTAGIAGPWITVGMSDTDNSATATVSGTNGILAWGAQLETGTVATSPIITYGSAVLRAADPPEIATSLFPYNVSEGTLYIEAVLASGATVGRLLSLNDNSGTVRVADIFITSATTQAYYKTSDSSQITYTSIATTGLQRVALRYKLNDFNVSYNGTLGGADTATGAIQTATMLEIGHLANANQAPMLIKRVAYFPDGKADAALQALGA